MKLYIDIEHFKSLAMSSSSEQFGSIVQMLRHDCDIVLTFAKQDLYITSKKQAVLKIDSLWKQFQTNRGKLETLEENGEIPTFSVPENNFEDYTSLYFVDSSKIIRGLQCPAVGEEIKALTGMYVNNRYIPTKQYHTPEMRDWSQIENDSCSCTDIIITDQYLFAQSDIYYQKNAYDLICALCQKSKNVKVNIVIFTLATYKDGDINREVNFLSIERNLKRKVEEVIGEEPNITFVKLPIKSVHDRKIFTNYKSFSSGDSYKYFIESNGEIQFASNGMDLYSNTHIDRDNLRNAQLFIAHLQEVVNDRAGGLSSISGDKKSNFLHFS